MGHEEEISEVSRSVPALRLRPTTRDSLGEGASSDFFKAPCSCLMFVAGLEAAGV